MKKLLPPLRRELNVDMVIANCENAAHGKGITERTAHEIFSSGADVLTCGNHTYRQRGSDAYIDAEQRLVRPINFPPGAPGRGMMVFKVADGGPKVGIVNACGRGFMGSHYDDPFRALDNAVQDLRRETNIIIVDFHAETTSEKVAMGWYLDGRVTAVLGTHTHIPTADERLLHQGTAYITDVGMTGPYDSVIGDDKDGIIEALRTQRPKKFEVAANRETALCAVLIEINASNGEALSIQRVRRELG